MTKNDNEMVWREGATIWSLIILVTGLLISIHYEGLSTMVNWWESREEYGHGFIIPFITAFLIWQKKDQLEVLEFKASWLGTALVIFGLLVFYVGELSAIYAVIQYAFLITLFGITISLMGVKAFKVISIPFFILLFMVPLPNFIFNTLSAELQLVSSQIGVAVIRLFDISVFLEGNVIDLGTFKLQVVEACSGLNYLFPLMTLAFISAYFFTGSFWKKVVIFLSSIPITILMNSFRIGVIGVMVEYWGIAMAEGFLHDFEGWIVFMACILILISEMWILAKIGKDSRPLRETFGLDFPEPTPEGVNVKYRAIPKSFIASLLVVSVSAASVLFLPDRVEIIPERKSFSEFPLEFNNWVGKAGTLEKNVLEILKLSDYLMVDYKGEDAASVNFYSAYYDSQKKGASAHSPKSCIPGGGWRIASLENRKIKSAKVGKEELVVNRLLIEKGENKQLVYYWFQQRSRVITNEYMMKWYLFWDAVTQSRTDGALIRLTTVLGPNQSIEAADSRLESFVKEISPIITEYVPQ